MVPGVAGAEVAVLAVPVEDREEGDVLELPQLRNGQAAVLVLLVRLVRVVAPLSGPGEAVRCERLWPGWDRISPGVSQLHRIRLHLPGRAHVPLLEDLDLAVSEVGLRVPPGGRLGRPLGPRSYLGRSAGS